MRSLLLFFVLFFVTPVFARAGIVFDLPLVTAPCAVGQAVVEADFPFRVEAGSSGPVSVSSIKASCDCTTGEADAASYASGASGKIKVKFVVGERTGLQRKTILVKTSDGKSATAFFQTTVPVILDIQPAAMFWKKGSEPEEKVVRVKSVLKDRDVRVLGAEVTPKEAFAVKIDALSTREWIVRVKPLKTDSVLRGRVVLQADFPKDDVKRFIIAATVR